MDRITFEGKTYVRQSGKWIDSRYMVVHEGLQLIPDKDEIVEIILFDNLSNPLAKLSCIHGKATTNSLHLENLCNKRTKCVILICPQFFQNIVGLIPAQYISIRTGCVDIKALLVFAILKITDQCILQGNTCLILNTVFDESALNALLDSND